MSFIQTSRQPELVQSISYPYQAHGTRRALSSKHRNLGKQFLAIFIIGIIGFLFWTPGSDSTPKTLGVSAQNVQPEQQTEAAKEPEPLKALNYEILNNEVNAIVKQYPRMDIGVSWIDIKTGETGDLGVQDPFVAASTAKLLTAIAFLHDVEDGRDTLSEPVGNRTAQAALEAMIVNSDNDAWHEFNSSVMSHAELATYAASIGFTEYNPDRNTITPGSLAKLMSNLYQKRLIDEEHTNLLLSYMERAKEVEYVSNLAPDGTTVYHKPGYLEDRMHDVAIVDDGERPYVLVIFTKSRTGVYNTTAGADVFTRVAKASFSTFIQGR